MSNTDSNQSQGFSAAALSQWAKWDWESGEGLSLVQHLTDAQDVGFYLWDEWLPSSVKRVLEGVFGTEEKARAWVAFYAGSHDNAKASAAFSAKVPELFSRVHAQGLTFGEPPSAKQMRNAPHGASGANALKHWLVGEYDFDDDVAVTYASPIGGHHGKFPNASLLSSVQEFEDAFESDGWADVRFELLDAMRDRSGLTDADIEERQDDDLSAPVQMLLTAIVVMADWIASNAELFPLSMSDQASESRSEDAIDALDLPDPWEPQPSQGALNLFQSRFDLPEGAEPYPVQLDAVTLAQEALRPGLFLVEAPTGEGKTEAALAVAEVLATKFGCGGVQIALPTCATSDAMFSRVLKWLDRAIATDQLASAMLMHSRAQFNDEFQELKFPAQNLSPIYDEDFNPTSNEPAVEAHWWLRSRKTAALADFTVGTIDQFLFVALQSKHVMLRHLGVAGKVLILDEVHAADIYMQQYLYRALEWCGAYEVPVVALSATLPPDTRKKLMESYILGQLKARNLHQLSAQLQEQLKSAAQRTEYPLLTFANEQGVEVRAPKGSSRRQEIALEYCADPDVATLLSHELVDGGCAVVVCNTVARAQVLYDDICASGDFAEDEVFLLHSRFTAADRRRKERELVGKYGKSGARPCRGVVVSTQIVEQSLDLDFDIMFSDFAPMDLLIQRAGRVHRHQRSGRPSRLARPRLVLFGVSRLSINQAPEFVAGSKRIYGASLLLRTANSLLQRDSIVSPDDVAGLVRHTYERDMQFPEEWQEEWIAAEDKRDADDQMRADKASRSLGPGPQELDMSRWFQLLSGEEHLGQSQVRDIEESIEVVIVLKKDGKFYSLPWLDRHAGESLSDANGIEDGLAREVAKCTVSIPFWQVGDVDDFIRELESYGSPAWQTSSWLRGLLPLPIDERGRCEVNGVRFSYDMKYGLRANLR